MDLKYDRVSFSPVQLLIYSFIVSKTLQINVTCKLSFISLTFYVNENCPSKIALKNRGQ